MTDRDTLKPWRRSTRSQECAARCIEAAGFFRGIVVRGSKGLDGSVLWLDAQGWAAFLRACRSRLAQGRTTGYPRFATRFDA